MAEVNGVHVLDLPAGLSTAAAMRTAAGLGLSYPADLSSAAWSHVGGNVATRASGPTELAHGGISGSVESLLLGLADGSIADTARPQTIPAPLRTRLIRLQADLRADAALLAGLDRHAALKWSGLPDLVSFLAADDPGGLLRSLAVGGVGIGALILRARIRLRPSEADRALLLVALERGRISEVSEVCRHGGALAVELIDAQTRARVVPSDSLPLEVPGQSELLLVSVPADRLKHLQRALPESAVGIPAADPLQARIWTWRKSLLYRLRQLPAPRSAPGLINDLGVPPGQVDELLYRVREMARSHSIALPVYGHAGSGNLHFRPILEDRKRETVSQFMAFCDAAARCALALGGTVCGEHGMGPIRNRYLAAEWDPGMPDRLTRIADALDPGGVFSFTGLRIADETEIAAALRGADTSE